MKAIDTTAGPSPKHGSFLSHACLLLGLLALALYLATLAGLPNRLRVPRSISSEVEARRTRVGNLVSLSAALVAFGAGYASRRSSENRSLRGLGLLCAAIPVAMLFLPWLSTLGPAGSREAAVRAQCVNNLKQIDLALMNYESAQGAFPPRVHRDRQGRPLLSWRVLILPYLEQSDLFSRFHLDEPWDSPHNRTLIDRIPSTYICPSQAEWTRNQTLYQVLDGSGAFLDTSAPTRFVQIADGPSNTIAVLEGPQPVPWTSPQDIPFRVDGPVTGWEAAHLGGFNAAFVDGSVRFQKSTIRESVLKALATRAGGEVIDANSY